MNWHHIACESRGTRTWSGCFCWMRWNAALGTGSDQ